MCLKAWTTSIHDSSYVSGANALCLSIQYAGLPKLNDANNAGTKHSEDCTLILTEGDSAMSLAVAGLAVIGRDSYGVFPLRCVSCMHQAGVHHY